MIENMSGLRPVGRAVLVKPDIVEERTAGGIVLPKDTRKREAMAEQKATVVEIGPLAWSGEPVPRAKVGERVLFSKWAGYSAEGVDDQEYRVVNDSDIFMVIVREK